MALLYESNLKYNNFPKLILLSFLWIIDIFVIILSPVAILIEVIVERNFIILITIPLLAFAMFLIHGKITTWLPENFEIHDDKVVTYSHRFFTPWKSDPFSVDMNDIEYGVVYPQTFFVKTTKCVLEANLYKYDRDHWKKLIEARRILEGKGIKFISSEEYGVIFRKNFIKK